MKHPCTSSTTSKPATLKNHTPTARERQSSGTDASDPSTAPVAKNFAEGHSPCAPVSNVQRQLRREEWDFGKLAGKEVLDCWKWEFQREIYRSNETVRLAVDAFRKGRTLDAQGLLVDHENKEKRFPWLAEGLAHYPQSIWPETPYQCVEPEYRRRVFGSLKEDGLRRLVSTVGRAQVHPLEQCSLDAIVKSPLSFGNWTQWPEGAVLDSGIDTLDLIGAALEREPIQLQCTVVALSLDWSFSNTEFKASFDRFLQAHRGTSRVLPNPERRGRETSESVLLTDMKALATMRLWRHFGSVEKAMNFVQKSRPSFTLYQNERDWSAAKHRVSDVVARLFEVEEIFSHQILGIPRDPVAKRISFEHMGK